MLQCLWLQFISNICNNVEGTYEITTYKRDSYAVMHIQLASNLQKLNICEVIHNILYSKIIYEI